MRSSGRRRVTASAVLLVAVLGLSRPSLGADAQVQADLTAQYYDVLSPYGSPVVPRRRYTHTLGLDVSDIDGETGFLAPELTFRSRLRLDADFGQYGAERDPEQLDQYIPGLEQAPFDLMYAYLEGRHYAGGMLGFRVGRQYQIDSLGWWSFDGALVRLDAPGIVGFEVYGGAEQRDVVPWLATDRFSADGVLRGDRGQLEANMWPQYLQQSRLAPAYGASVQTLALSHVDARLSYRKVINRDKVLVTTFPEEGESPSYVEDDRISTERVALSLALHDSELGRLGGDVVYDLFIARISEANAALDWYLSSATTLGVAYDYFIPTFDGDSIFNWFVHGPSQGVELNTSSALSQRVDVSGRAGVRIYSAELGADATSTRAWVDKLVAGTLRYRLPQAQLRFNADSQWGQTGHRVGGNLSGEHQFYEGYYDSLVAFSLYDYSDALRPQRDATSVGYVLGGGISPEVMGVVRTRLGFEWEHLFNRLGGHRFRVLLTLTLSEFP